MQLTRQTDYAFRLLIYLALLPQDQRASIDEVSKIYDVSRNNLNKIVHQLGKSGIIDTKRGKGGGFKLKLPAEQVNVGDLVELIENTLQVIDCKNPYCRILPVCELKDVFTEAKLAFIDTLKKYTLADIVEKRSDKLIQILEIKENSV